MSAPLTKSRVLHEAWPYILANATTPLLGLTDTAVLGHGGAAVDLAAIALGALVFSFSYWTFGFLRMSTTGFVAQAHGADRLGDVVTAGMRALVLGVSIGSLLLLAAPLLQQFAFSIFHGGRAEEELAGAYFRARIFGAPGALATLGASGLLIGLGRSREVLVAQLLTNGCNIVLDVAFVQGLGWGAEGVGWGTAIAEWVGCLVTVGLAVRVLVGRGVRRVDWAEVFSASGLRGTFRANRDIMIRTLSMILAFAFFTDQGARQGSVTLAANHLLLQFVSFSAFFLDGFANVAEAHVGAALGARARSELFRAIRVTTFWAACFGLLLGAVVFFFGASLLALLTDLPRVRAEASSFLVPAAAYVVASFGAFQLDGVFIGAGWSGSMRNAAVFCSASFLTGGWFAAARWGNGGLWWAFVAYVALRGLSLGYLLPRNLKSAFSSVSERDARS